MDAQMKKNGVKILIVLNEASWCTGKKTKQ